MPDATVEQRLAWLQNGVREIGKLCLQLGGDGAVSPVVPVSREPSEPRTQRVPTAPGQVASTVNAVPLSEFVANVPPLAATDRLLVVDAAIAMLEGVFVHLPLKRAMYGIDPVQRLKLLKSRLDAQIRQGQAPAGDRGFHDEMIDIFHSLRDLHTNYILPGSYRGKMAFLPFLVEEYFDGNPPESHYIVTKIQPGFVHPTFQVGVSVTHWNGIPIGRAVELNAGREAGSNLDARHARGLEAMTLRPMALTAPPDEAWVIIGYEAEGSERELRFQWQVTEPPPSASGADVHDSLALAGEAARVMGFDAQGESVRRAKKSIFEPEAMSRERQMARIVAAANAEATGAEESPAAILGADRSEAKTSGLFPMNSPGQQIRQSRRAILFPTFATAKEGVDAAVAKAEAASKDPRESADTEGPQNTSLLPDFFTFRTVDTSRGTFGYVRIWSFMAYDADAFVAEFARIASMLPQNGLILDVRGNGGGNIAAGEKLLQVLSPRPVTPERFHFINTPMSQRLCESEPSLQDWVSSIELSVQTGETYSQGFPLTGIDSLDIGYRYPGKLVLVVDALCYSTTDIFAAGFQDNELGPVLGTTGRTGAGGANVWPYEYFQALPGFVALPQGVGFRTAVRRSTRVGAKAGVPLEDLGVQPAEQHFMTRRDVLQNNADLIEHAARLL